MCHTLCERTTFYAYKGVRDWLNGIFAGVNELVGEVIPTRVKLTFSQAQNMIADIAVERNYSFYFWGHSDVGLMASNSSTKFANEV